MKLMALLLRMDDKIRKRVMITYSDWFLPYGVQRKPKWVGEKFLLHLVLGSTIQQKEWGDEIGLGWWWINNRGWQVKWSIFR